MGVKCTITAQEIRAFYPGNSHYEKSMPMAVLALRAVRGVIMTVMIVVAMMAVTVVATGLNARPGLFDERAQLRSFLRAQRVQGALAVPERAGDGPERIGKPSVVRSQVRLPNALRLCGIVPQVLFFVFLLLIVLPT
jgi:hypothetical protein